MIGRSWPTDLLWSLARSAPAELRLHVGAHKTATTHLQDTLRAHRSALASRGVDFLPTPSLRELGFPLSTRGGKALPLSDALEARRLAGRLNRVRRGERIVAISDENWMRGIPDALAPDPYPDLATPFAAVGPLLRKSKARLFFSVRNMATFLPSAYAELLRFYPKTEGFERIARERRAAGASWLGPIRRLRTLLPDAPMTVWRYEDYRDHSQHIMSVFCGCEVGKLPSLPAPIATRSPSAEAIRDAEHLTKQKLSLIEYRREVQKLFNAAANGQKFAPFTSEERTWFAQRYEEDLGAIERIQGVTLLRFPAVPGERAPT